MLDKILENGIQNHIQNERRTNMKRILILVIAGLFVLSSGVLLAALDSKLIGDARSIDTKYAGPFNVNLEKWYAAHPVEKGKMFMEPIFQTPRITVMAAVNRGQVDLHYHRFIDDFGYVIKGQCEKYVNGKWVLVKPGTLNYNPRGIIHATRVVGDEPLWELVFFTPDAAHLRTRVARNQAGAPSMKGGGFPVSSYPISCGAFREETATNPGLSAALVRPGKPAHLRRPGRLGRQVPR